MDKWQLEVYDKLKPLEKIMLEHVKTGKVLNMDETTTQILHYENGNTERKKSYIWLAHGGPKNKQLAIYRYFESRSPQYIAQWKIQELSHCNQVYPADVF